MATAFTLNREELCTRALRKLGACGPADEPAPEDSALALETLDTLLKELPIEGFRWLKLTYDSTVIEFTSASQQISLPSDYGGEAEVFYVSSETEVDVTDADVTVGTDLFTVTDHGLRTGDPIRYEGTGFTGLTTGTYYYAIRASSSTFKLAATLALAQAGTAVDVTAAAADASGTFYRAEREEKLARLDWNAYLSLEEKAYEGSYPTQYAIRNDSKLFFWPAIDPDESPVPGRLYYRQLTSDTSTGAAPDAPDELRNSLIYSLCLHLGDEFGASESKMQRWAGIAETLKKKVLSYSETNDQRQPLRLSYASGYKRTDYKKWGNP